MTDKDFNEFLGDLDKWYECKNKYLKLCKDIDNYFGGHDKVPGDLGKYEIAYEKIQENLTNLEFKMYGKWVEHENN